MADNKRFDVDAAINAGHSKADVANYLAKEKGFDSQSARLHGYSDDDIIGEVTKAETAQTKEPPKVTYKGVLGALERGMAPYAAGTALGALAGAPFAGVGAIPGAAAGFATTAIEELGGGAYNLVAPRIGLPRYTTFGEKIGQGLDKLGVETPDTQVERLVQAGSGGGYGAGGLARSLENMVPRMAPSTTKEVLNVLSKQPLRQTASGVVGGGATQAALEAGAPPAVAGAAGIAAGGVPFLGRGSGALPQAVEAINKGYTIPPTSAAERPSVVGKILGSIGNEAEIEKLATVKNQTDTNMRVKSEIGLPNDAPITRPSLETVRANQGAVYNEVKKVPGNTIDGAFLRDVLDIDGAIASLKKKFPDIAKNDDVEKLIKSLVPVHGVKGGMTSGDAVELTRVLRARSAKNMNSDKPELVELGSAQKDASNAIEGLLSRRMQNSGKLDLAEKWQTARTKIAQSHFVEEALNPATGNVDAKKLGSFIDKGMPFTGELNTSGRLGLAFPRVSGTPEKSAPVTKSDPRSLMYALPMGMAYMGTQDIPTTLAIGAGSLTAPKLARAIAMSKPYQRAMAGSPPASKSDLAKALAATMLALPNTKNPGATALANE